MGIFISGGKTLECVVIALCFGALLALSSEKPIIMLERLGYNGKEFMRRAVKRANMTFERFLLLAGLCLLSAAVVSLCFSFAGDRAAIIGLAMYVLFFVLYIAADSKIVTCVPATRSKRSRRLKKVLFFVCVVVSYILVVLLNFAAEVWGSGLFNVLRYCALSILPVLLLPLICLSNLIAKIYETPFSRACEKKAAAEIAKSGITVIVITGSCGKTCVKDIIFSMLKKKYKALCVDCACSAAEVLCQAVRGNEIGEYDVLIAETDICGAGGMWSIRRICTPKFLVITGIYPEHAGMIKEKAECMRDIAERIYITSDIEKYFKDIDCALNVCGTVSDVEVTCGKTCFTIDLGGEKMRVGTKLLGAAAAENIAIAAMVASELGVSAKDMAAAADELEYVEHRLSFEQCGGLNILDDGYNSCLKGALSALEVLKAFDGRRIVITRGIVRYGDFSDDENKELGRALAGSDLVIVVGETCSRLIQKGYLEAEGDPQKIVVRHTIKDAKNKLKEAVKEGDAVLYLGVF